MVSNLLTLLPAVTLFILAVVVLRLSYWMISLYNNLREPIIIHGLFIMSQLFLTFATGSIGLFLELDQINHPLFNFNVFFLSLTYIGYGLIIQEVFRNELPVIVNYNLILLSFAPAFGFALILDGEFIPLIAILSQILPLISLTIFDYFIVKRVTQARLSLVGESEQDVASMMRSIFSFSLVIHALGIIVMIVLSFLFIVDYEIDIEQIWVDKWNVFDYGYFLALLVILWGFHKMQGSMAKLAKEKDNVQLDKIINMIIS